MCDFNLLRGLMYCLRLGSGPLVSVIGFWMNITGEDRMYPVQIYFRQMSFSALCLRITIHFRVPPLFRSIVVVVVVSMEMYWIRIRKQKKFFFLSQTQANLEIYLQFKNFYLKSGILKISKIDIKCLKSHLLPTEGTQWYVSRCRGDESLCSTTMVASLCRWGCSCRLFKSHTVQLVPRFHHHLIRRNTASYIPGTLVAAPPSIGHGTGKSYCWCVFSALTWSTGWVDLKGRWSDSSCSESIYIIRKKPRYRSRWNKRIAVNLSRRYKGLYLS